MRDPEKISYYSLPRLEMGGIIICMSEFFMKTDGGWVNLRNGVTAKDRRIFKGLKIYQARNIQIW